MGIRGLWCARRLTDDFCGLSRARLVLGPSFRNNCKRISFALLHRRAQDGWCGLHDYVINVCDRQFINRRFLWRWDWLDGWANWGRRNWGWRGGCGRWGMLRRPCLASMVTFSVSSGVEGMNEAGEGVGTAGSEAATPTKGRGNRGERTGLDGAVLPGDEMAARLLGMTVKELRDWSRKLASARACRSPGGRRERSGRGDGRISKLGDKGGDVGLGVQSARARWLSGEHGTLALEAPSVLSPVPFSNRLGRRPLSVLLGIHSDTSSPAPLETSTCRRH